MPEIESCICVWLRVPLQLFNPTGTDGHQITLTQSQASLDPTLIQSHPHRLSDQIHTQPIQPANINPTYCTRPRIKHPNHIRSYQFHPAQLYPYYPGDSIRQSDPIRIPRNFLKILSEFGLWTDIRIPSVVIR
jgi:hypothetical protein